MFYVFNVQQWLEEVVSACNENNLDPESSVFVLLMFSSLDYDFVTFFRDRKPQISQYSGRNVHIFTPMIFEETLVSDDEWRLLRERFSDAGIPVGNRPAAILFHLRKRSEATGYENWVSFEGAFFHAQNTNKLIIPVVLDDHGKSLVRELPFLQGRLYLDWSNADARRESVARLSSALSQLQRG